MTADNDDPLDVWMGNQAEFGVGPDEPGGPKGHGVVSCFPYALSLTIILAIWFVSMALVSAR